MDVAKVAVIIEPFDGESSWDTRLHPASVIRSCVPDLRLSRRDREVFLDKQLQEGRQGWISEVRDERDLFLRAGLEEGGH